MAPFPHRGLQNNAANALPDAAALCADHFHLRVLGTTPRSDCQLMVSVSMKIQDHPHDLLLHHIAPSFRYDRGRPTQVDQAGIDILLVGDSAGMVIHGHDTTLPVTIEDMLSHCKAVARGASRPFLVGDMPFGSYEVSEGQAVQTAMRLLKEGGMDAVKMEGPLSCCAAFEYVSRSLHAAASPFYNSLLLAEPGCEHVALSPRQSPLGKQPLLNGYRLEWIQPVYPARVMPRQQEQALVVKSVG